MPLRTGGGHEHARRREEGLREILARAEEGGAFVGLDKQAREELATSMLPPGYYAVYFPPHEAADSDGWFAVWRRAP